jgi:diguanylate cyclase (GGDEF)-like protein
MVIGTSQSAIWVWHFWHILFPGIIVAALWVHDKTPRYQVPFQRVLRGIGIAVAATVALVLLITAAVTLFHDHLPVLIRPGIPVPLTRAFYLVGGACAVVTVVALALALRHVGQRIILHLWLAVILSAFLSDIAASLSAYARYTVGWYFGRIESMLAASMLLLVFLSEINRLYRDLARAMHDLSEVNRTLSRTLGKKETLLTKLRASEAQVRQLAYYDPVTELPNRRLLLDRLESTLLQASRYSRSLAVMFLDLDDFKAVNDSLGHDAGDALLRSVAGSLRKCVRNSDTVARLGGDEFVMLLPQIASPDDAVAVARKVLNRLAAPVDIAGHRLRASASIGIAIGPGGQAPDAEHLLARADAAMYSAKRSRAHGYHLADSA